MSPASSTNSTFDTASNDNFSIDGDFDGELFSGMQFSTENSLLLGRFLLSFIFYVFTC